MQAGRGNYMSDMYTVEHVNYAVGRGVVAWLCVCMIMFYVLV